MAGILFEHVRLLDCTGAEPLSERAVAVEDGRIARIGASGTLSGAHDRVIDCAGRTLMPGLIDCHVHLAIIEIEPGAMEREPVPAFALRVAREMEATLGQGFTSVRDAGGLDWGYKEAARRGLVRSPRLWISNGFISQTGGHGDFRSRAQVHEPRSVPGHFSPSLVVDGPERVRWAAREVLRRGADQVKVMANGGCMSPTDEIDAPQFTVAELRAAVEAAEAAGTYVLAHTYTPRSMQNCLAAGVRSLEHGNFLDEETARMMAEAGAYLVPTIATYELIAEFGPKLGVPDDNVRKIREALTGAYESLKIAAASGVRIGSGSDLLGPQSPFKAREFSLQARVLGTMGALLAATRTNAEILRVGDELGTVEEGKLADLILVDGDPTADLAVLEDPANIHVVMLGGEVAVERG